MSVFQTKTSVRFIQKSIIFTAFVVHTHIKGRSRKPLYSHIALITPETTINLWSMNERTTGRFFAYFACVNVTLRKEEKTLPAELRHITRQTMSVVQTISHIMGMGLETIFSLSLSPYLSLSLSFSNTLSLSLSLVLFYLLFHKLFFSLFLYRSNYP